MRDNSPSRGGTNDHCIVCGRYQLRHVAWHVNETVNPGPDFSIAASPTSITIASPGQTGSTSLMLSAMNGLTGTFNLVPQCVNLPSESTCAVSPASVTFSSTMTTATVMLMVSTRAPSSVPAIRRFQPTNNRPGAIFAIGLFGLLSLLGLRRGTARNSSRFHRSHICGSADICGLRRGRRWRWRS